MMMFFSPKFFKFHDIENEEGPSLNDIPGLMDEMIGNLMDVIFTGYFYYFFL